MALPYQNLGPISPPPQSFRLGAEEYRPPLEYLRYYPIWTTLRDLFDGASCVKAKGETYLRKLSSHTTEEYKAYLSRTPFYNAIRRTHMGLMASLFRRDPEYSLPPALDNSLGKPDDIITTNGLTRLELIKYMAHELLLVGRFGALVDYPDSSDAIKTPLISTYTAENIIGWRTTIHKGSKITDRVILRENFETPTEYATTAGERIRVLRLDQDSSGNMVYSQQIFSYDRNGLLPNIAPKVITPKILGNTLDYIPFEFVNPLTLRPDIETPPLSDLAAVNLDHYEASALLAHALFYAGMPTYYIAEDGSDLPQEMLGTEQMAVGPSNIWRLAKDSKAGVLEFTGHGLSFLENSVSDKQGQMQSLGGRLITSQRRTASLTSEAYNVMEASDKATLMDVAYAIERAVTRLFRHWAEFASVTLSTEFLSKNLVEINKEFDNGELSAREIRALQTLYERQLIPLDVLYYTLRQIGVIPMEYSLDEFRVLLEQDDQLYKDPKLELEKQKMAQAEKARKDALAAAEAAQQQQNNANPPQQQGNQPSNG